MEQLNQRLVWANKRVSFAWAKYYEAIRRDLNDDWGNYRTFNRVADDREIPEHIKNEMKEMAAALKKKWECPVCLDMIENADLEITNCGHYYCKGCLDGWKAAEKARGETKWKCGCCNRKHGFTEE